MDQSGSHTPNVKRTKKAKVFKLTEKTEDNNNIKNETNYNHYINNNNNIINIKNIHKKLFNELNDKCDDSNSYLFTQRNPLMTRIESNNDINIIKRNKMKQIK